MKSAAHDFPARARSALDNPDLARALARARSGFIDRRLAVIETLPEFQALRRTAREIKEHTLQHLDWYLERFEARVREHGGHVHWASTPAEARAVVLDICRAAGAKRVTKGKSMVAEEIGLNDALEGAGFEVIETDLGEYIIQLADEPPSHIIVPAIHKTKDQISDLFHAHHAKYGLTERQTEAAALVGEARAVLREKFQSAEVGITGANFLVAETGSSVIVTNEGNGDLTSTLPRVHIVTAAIEKVVPTLDDMSTILRLLARSATGQETTAYTTVTSGPRRARDLDGPGRVPRRAGRQRPLADARQRVPRDAALHPLRRVHEPLSRLPCGGRTRLRLGLRRSDGLGADPADRGARQGKGPSERMHPQRTMRGGVSHGDSAPGPDPQAPRARVRPAHHAAAGSSGPAGVGVRGPAPGPVPSGDVGRDARPRSPRALPRPVSPAAAGRRLDRNPRSAGPRGPDVHVGVVEAPGGGGAMSAARERILGAVRRSLGRAGPLPESVRARLERRLAAPTPNLKPALAEDPVSLFVRKANAVHTRTTVVPTLAGVSEAVLRHIDDNGLGDAIVVAPELEGLQWSNRLAVEGRAARGADQLGVTGAFAGIAETGSVMLLSGPESPTTLNFLPEDHIVVLRASRIVPHPEDAWALLRAERGTMPRTVNLICGPSKTGDVELVITEGAHGPRRFHVVVVRE